MLRALIIIEEKIQCNLFGNDILSDMIKLMSQKREEENPINHLSFVNTYPQFKMYLYLII